MSDIAKLSAMEGELAHMIEAINRDEQDCRQRDVQIQALEGRLEVEVGKQDEFLGVNERLNENFQVIWEYFLTYATQN